MLQLHNIEKSFVHHPVFKGLSLQVGEKTRLGLIGRNGCGKSTLLKTIMGKIEPDGGSIYRAPGIRINYLSQEPQVTPHFTLEEEMKSVFVEINQLQAEEAELLARLDGADQGHEALANRLAKVHDALHRLDAQSVDARISRMLKGLGFSLDSLDRRVSEFSGGWQMRINLAKVLLEGADILLLDEPTNHLDLDACEWLESFLREYPGGLVIVSHDRRFLDQVATEIAEIELGRLRVYSGNYSSFVEQKAHELELSEAAYDRQQKEIAKQTAFVERFRASATRSTQAKSREKQLEKIERVELRRTDNSRMTMSFPPPEPSGKQVLTLRGVSKAFGENHLFKGFDGDIQRHQRIFLLGANGTGKTTLLRLILGLESLDSGEIREGHKVIPGYFSQHQLETLDASLSAFDTIHNAYPRLTQTEVRGLLARFLFTGEDVFKPVAVLSGGEKSKLALAKLILSGPNFLLLDEPTNHMDIPAKEVLEDALREYDGTFLCISHDRYFIQQLATHIWEIHEGRLLKYDGDYNYYLEKRDEVRQKAMASAVSAKQTQPSVSSPVSKSPAGQASPLKARKEVEKQVNQVEKTIMALETEIEAISAQLGHPDVQSDYARLQELNEALTQKQAELDKANAHWESLAEQLASFG